jgi:hypothetical protein
VLKLTIPVPEDDIDDYYYDDKPVGTTLAPSTTNRRRLPYKQMTITLGVVIIYRAYLFVCVNSLHKKFEDEKLTRVRSEGPLSLFA